MERDQMLCGLTRPAIEAGLVGEIDQQARRERANRELIFAPPAEWGTAFPNVPGPPGNGLKRFGEDSTI